MGHECKKSVGIIGAGASGCLCAYFLLKKGIEVTLFDKGSPLRTLLPTGGGRCNLSHSEFDFKELVKNYPRGEKFLLSVFSKFGVGETIELFESFGLKTYTQEDGKIFPISNSANEVREKILNHVKNAQFHKEEVLEISQKDSGYKVKTNKATYFFTDVVVSVGGHTKLDFLKNFNLKIKEQKPALVGLNSNINAPSGVVLKNVYSKDFGLCGDILFTHFGISGPLIYTISSLNAYKNYPYKLKFDLYNNNFDLQNLMNKNPHKEMKNVLSTIFPISFAKFLLSDLENIKAHKIDGNTRNLILNKIHCFELNITGPNKGEETVTAGGIDLNEINSKTMETKKYPHLFFTGEILDIDGFCGGFNLQNAWSTAFIASQGICMD